MDNETFTVSCPTCKKSVEWGEHSPYRPFCSKRCQLIDLGEWADEEKRIPSNEDISDSDEWSEEPRH
ncbi:MULTISPECIES: DNA gyrase inhibitor YacG [unclassified Symbiopectobacterium]|uniref:DNA gyrase inhibitor YacG n=1 Tax=unclassified Symbiopectobacterium TaxID=2794573 RepID=UPI0022272F48|nr:MULTISPECIES: DNA gyrase inhibitor YacG [unclassified Symbiopectobacterium]MCW2476116.1 DNA gyrase inhibitor YacG [Candidatus Symbiopectobacterium sp. NZEC151]MCW2487122.1 DNA gyrase inhibitor YacG [Candidatus Symbiopectobacterium sp. NZEC127]